MQSLIQAMFRRKSVEELSTDRSEGPKLQKALTSWDVFTHGVAAIIGTGIFVLTGVAAAEHAGPGIILSFVAAGIVCAFVSFAYSELSSMIPRAGSAYTYAWSMGELVAWFIGWDLLLEYCVGASAVAVGWSAYMQHILKGFGITLPSYLAAAPADMPWQDIGIAIGALVFGGFGVVKAVTAIRRGGLTLLEGILGLAGIVALVFAGTHALVAIGHITSIDLLAVCIIAFINVWLVKGVTHTAKMTAVFVVIKLAVIALFIAVGVWHVNPANWHPFLPFGWQGVFAGAGVVFFAYIGFDAVSTLAEECKNPSRDMPRGTIWSLIVCGILYVAVAAVMTGCLVYTQLGGDEAAAPMAKVMDAIGNSWAAPLVSLGAIAGISSVLIVLLFGQSRIMMSMARDGLIFKQFGTIHPQFKTPVFSIVVLGILAAATAGLLPINELAQLTSIGTLAAFVLCCLGVIVLRRTEPDRPRTFKCPGYPWVPALGVIFCLVLMFSLPTISWVRFLGWMGIGLLIWMTYGRYNSTLNQRAVKPSLPPVK